MHYEYNILYNLTNLFKRRNCVERNLMCAVDKSIVIYIWFWKNRIISTGNVAVRARVLRYNWFGLLITVQQLIWSAYYCATTTTRSLRGSWRWCISLFIPNIISNFYTFCISFWINFNTLLLFKQIVYNTLIYFGVYITIHQLIIKLTINILKSVKMDVTGKNIPLIFLNNFDLN